MSGSLRIAGIVKGTEVNGPGRRNMLHLQGCSIRCPGCFNPQTWDQELGESWSVDRLVQELVEDGPDGITISGGEPMEQAQELIELLRSLRNLRPKCSILMYTGYTAQQLDRKVWWGCVKELVDVVVSGPYMRDRHVTGQGLISSSNQQILLLGRHTIREIWPIAQVEAIIQEDGTILLTGFPTQHLIQSMEAM